MSEIKHTPAPWRIIEREVQEDGSVYPRHIIGGSRGLTICPLEHMSCADEAVRNPDGLSASDKMIEAGGDVRSKMANARLIAAAPDMLQALRPFLPAYRAYVETMRNFTVDGETSAERRASEGERKDEAEERAFEELSKVTFEILAAVNAAVAKAEGRPCA